MAIWSSNFLTLKRGTRVVEVFEREELKEVLPHEIGSTVVVLVGSDLAWVASCSYTTVSARFLPSKGTSGRGPL